MAKIIVLQHHPAENLGAIAEALESAALAWQYVRVDQGRPVPKDMKGAGGLIVMGGPMAVYQTERFPFLKDELLLIEDAIKNGRPVLGVCLGAQIVAAALGAKVEKNPAGKEIGWYPVRLLAAAREDRLFRGLAETITPFHWHGDYFDAPSGAVALAASDKTPCQAFRYGEKTWALQFHLEVTRAGVENMAGAFARDLEREKISANTMLAASDAHLPALETIAETVFSRWATPIQGT
ncbi:MAG TPA: gamma-glutamyl-gamma-aminobutyrate hydrolase family protein [Candidatus Binataceae bacterium]|nr:gamma-glutamyl-gamma-aminobutyrate hydrolase family protein [Candidatus Binataceae bacterium]